MRKTKVHTQRRSAKRSRSLQRFLIFGGAGLLLLAGLVLGFSALRNLPDTAQLLGEEVPITSRDHAPSDVPISYNSNPPAGGAHYAEDFPARFYQESDLATLPPYPEGYLVHNLEHGYVIFWYNCQLSGTDCTALKQTIRQVMDETGNTKLIAFPWSKMDVPLAMTSWGRILKFSQPDPALMKKFVERNRNHAPEPEAD